MAIDDGLICHMRKFPQGGLAYDFVIRCAASPKNPWEGLNVGSYALWMYSPMTTGTVINASAANGVYELYRYHEDSIDKFRVRWPLSDGTGLLWYTTGGTAGQDLQVNHIGVSRDTNLVSFYLNGSLVDSEPIATTNNDNEGSGNWQMGTAQGPVTDFSAWSRVVSASEFSDLYDAGQGGWPSSGGGSVSRSPFSNPVFGV